MIINIKSEKVRQVFSLYASMSITIVVSIGVSVINTHALGPQSFGDFKFFQTLFSLVLTMSTLGLFVSGGRLIAQEPGDSERRALSSSMLFLAFFLSIFLMLFLWIFSYQNYDVLADGKGHTLRLIIPLFLALPLQFLLENSLKVSNKIYDLVILRVLPGILYLSMAYLLYINKNLNLVFALYLYFGAILLVAIIILLRQGLVFSGMTNSVIKIVNEVKVYGFHVYVGTVSSVGTTLLGSVALAFFIDTVAMG